MAFFSNIFGTQSTGPTETTPPAATNTPAPAVPNPAPAAAEIVSPLDTFKDLWNTSANSEVDTTLPANMFSGADPAKMLAAARSVDFSKSIPPEVLSQITAGGPEAATAFAKALNDVSQRAYAQSSFASTKIVEAALAKFQEGLDNRLPSQLKRLQVNDAVRESNPALQHPAAAPIMEALQAQFTVKFPNASVSELKQMASDYLTQFATAALPKPAAASVPEAENWDKFFG